MADSESLFVFKSCHMTQMTAQRGAREYLYIIYNNNKKCQQKSILTLNSE